MLTPFTEAGAIDNTQTRANITGWQEERKKELVVGENLPASGSR